MLRSTCSARAFGVGSVPQGCGRAHASSLFTALKGHWLKPEVEQRSAHGIVWEDENRCVE